MVSMVGVGLCIRPQCLYGLLLSCTRGQRHADAPVSEDGKVVGAARKVARGITGESGCWRVGVDSGKAAVA
jgi:hypothetical protein